MSRGLRLTPAQLASVQNGLGGKKPSKYGNRKKVIDGIEFDSTKEARRWQDLCLMQRAGQIRYLRRQVRYPVDINAITVCTWIADFVYEEFDSGQTARTIVEDAKGFKTEIYRLKKKLVEAFYAILIRET